jgi:hypothetical protein
MNLRFHPTGVWVVWIVAFLSASVQRCGVMLGYWGQAHNPNFEFSLIIVLSYGSSLILCLRIAREHERSPAMHFAWMLFAGSCTLSIVRHAIYCLMALDLTRNVNSKEIYLASQLPMAVALVLFFVGLLSMWSAFSALGLGFHIQRSDAAIVTLMLLMLPPILFRDPEGVAKFITGWIAILPFTGAILLPACAGIAVFLRRTAIQMRGGDTARFLLFLICYPAMRLVAMLITVDSHLNRFPALIVFGYAIFHTAPLIFTLALAYRWEITSKASVAMKAERSTWHALYPVEVSTS